MIYIDTEENVDQMVVTYFLINVSSKNLIEMGKNTRTEPMMTIFFLSKGKKEIKMLKPRPSYLSPEKPVCGLGSNS